MANKTHKAEQLFYTNGWPSLQFISWETNKNLSFTLKWNNRLNMLSDTLWKVFLSQSHQLKVNISSTGDIGTMPGFFSLFCKSP